MNNSDRRLAAIMFTDMVGYSRLSQQDESVALELLTEHFQIIREILPIFGGTEVDVAGDGFLIEFASALEAVNCAIEIQQSLTKRNSSVTKYPIELRIGIHMGDVICLDGRVRGDVVNIASRLQHIAEPGGVCVTRQVFDHVDKKIKKPLQSLGQQRLKNIQIPIEVFRIIWSDDQLAQQAYQDKKRIAVLPFRNISSDRNNEYFADGMTDELIGKLSKIRDLKIIAMTSVLKYKNAAKSISDIGKELGVGSIIEGSIRKHGDRVRITVQFVEAVTETTVWTEEYDRELRDIFEVQAEISKAVVNKLQIELQSHERELIERKETVDLLAHEYYLHGSWYLQNRTESSLQRSIEFFQKAVDQDPNYGAAYAGLAESYLIFGFHGFMPTKMAYPAAKVAIEKALQLDPHLAHARVSLAAIYMLYMWEWEKTARELEKAIEVNPNDAQAYHYYGLLHGALGKLEKATELFKHAKELDPFTLAINGNLGFGYYYAKRYDESIKQYEMVLQLEPRYLWAHYYVASCYNQKKMYDKALEHFLKEKDLWDRRNPAIEFGIAYTKDLSGDSSALRKLLEEWRTPEKSDREVPYLLALSHFHLGEVDKGFEWLEEARGRKSRGMLFVTSDPILDSVRTEPRYQTFLKSVNLDSASVEKILGYD